MLAFALGRHAVLTVSHTVAVVADSVSLGFIVVLSSVAFLVEIAWVMWGHGVSIMISSSS